MSTFLQTRLVPEAEFWTAFDRTGAIYFIRNVDADAIKIGHSRDPAKRLSNLQVGCSGRLELIGVIAAAREIEPIVHDQLFEGRIRGEWFWDRGVTSQWLSDMTQGEPLFRHVWKLVPGQEFVLLWDATTKSHTKFVFDRTIGKWVNQKTGELVENPT
ncbi:GIY-YIG nuclease family protein [Bradyrhizobium diazoefficiens]|nr:GIY-YIG nuclease family protein [Bradyrhizobium diazoefficiens]QQN61489.1 GIY-YIG nuclease family protein [Bradyrhizobium diazoefficiens]